MIIEYTALREYVRDAIISAWPTATVVLAQDAKERTPDFAYVATEQIDFMHQTPVSEILTFTFVIAGRFELPSGGDASLLAAEKASDLRAELLTAGNPGGVGMLHRVTSVDLSAQSESDEVYDVLLTFEVMANADR